MVRMLLCLLAILCTMGRVESGAANKDMNTDVFVFQRDDHGMQSHVTVQPLKEEPLRSFRLCFRTYTDTSRPYSLFHLRSVSSPFAEITVYKESSKSYTLTVGREDVIFYTQEAINKWEHLCFSWESATGTARLWVDEKPMPRKGLSKGYVIPSKANLMLGKRRSMSPFVTQFTGEMYDVSMWDYVLSWEDIQKFQFGPQSVPPGNILNWRNLTYEEIGHVVVQPYQ
ncbi:C-reactive protein-like [Ambystoma mexicanum]|uniref:C-reactive protein-like n=1 Tax=Ambystoma mexicanum TaxID=8296 RepID=UPI0037E84B12